MTTYYIFPCFQIVYFYLTVVFLSQHSLTELAEIAGGVVDIGSMRMEVTRPVQGTFALTLDDTKIYTNIKR